MTVNDYWAKNWTKVVGTIVVLLLGVGLRYLNLETNPNGIPKMFLQSSLGILIMCILNLWGLNAIARKKPTGWILMATSFYFMALSINGLGMLPVLLIGLACCRTWATWKEGAKSR